MNYKLEELKFLNMKKVPIHVSNPRLRGGLSVFQIEKTLTEEEKLDIIDQLRNGVGSYLLNILLKWESEKGTLPQDQYGRPKKVSKKAWIKRNDPRGIIDNNYKVGHYWLFKTQFKELSKICPTTEYGHSMEHTGQLVVHQWFHDLCKELRQTEQKYFNEHNPQRIKLAKVKEYGERYRVYFNNDDINDIVWNSKENVSEHDLDEFIKAYEELQGHIERISVNLNQKKLL